MQSCFKTISFLILYRNRMDYLQFPRHFSLLVFFSLFNGLKSKYQGCNPEPVNALFLIHGASIESGNRRNFTEQLVRDVTSSLHKDSKKNFYLLAETAKELVVDSNSSEDTVINKIFAEDMKSATKSTTLSSEAINNVLSSTFSVNLYKNRAEFVILLVTNETELDAVSPFLQKKKTVVVVLGSSIPHIFKSVASREDYLYQVGSFKDLEMVIGKIKELIACDSYQYCDTDMYSLRKGSKCRSCAGPCSQNTDICIRRCPFVSQKYYTKDNASAYINVTTGATGVGSDNVGISIQDNKDWTIVVLVGSLVVVLVLVLALFVGIKIKCCHKGKHPSRSSSDTFPPENEMQVVKYSIQEETQDEDQPFIGGHEAQACGSDPTTATESNIPVNFKNGQEWDLNVDADRDQFRPLHP